MQALSGSAQTPLQMQAAPGSAEAGQADEKPLDADSMSSSSNNNAGSSSPEVMEMLHFLQNEGKLGGCFTT